MTELLLVLMGFHLHGEIVHEWAGIIFTLLIILHLYLNRHRLWSLSPNIPLTMRVVNRAINVVTFAVILTAIVSGMMLSRHILLELPFHNPASWVRKVHMTSVHWGMLILALHIGLHWKMLATFFCRILNVANNSLLANIIMPGIFSLIALLGLYTLLNQDYLDYLLMKVDFSFFDYDESALLFYLRYLAIVVLFSLMTRFLLWFFIFRKDKAVSPQ
ncbi:DUF4405 domain-containing protein [Salmonella enterica subsp. enterica serovar Montevideo]|uniref:DUF4405 domain-containing protein n=1 Tax=Enterobacter hormaechei TaxID=158836 RepID=UPI00127E50BD|nr:DUF4405 domain-containing protein [Enterobacter hormaechei]EAN6653638.1 DUF4405 domain-containing protein [Salmonella enterica]EBV5295725.1 hypothetical protein [Salmonella enterica subsp. enterica serovar Sandiego]ECS6189181.1 DUF4405 domain-containing protein [Salmonella enterica subsp. enterica serovar Enteritidis]EEB3718913.1 DUF4405 domain-containing protein [Salmonella enterica subsp. enterica serovar Panama]EEH4251342.1 DUF4405 domain-containing protein [Salmonella enterica subsp. en